jgi:quercetin dioxygenase-like cupin family protein
MKSPKSVLVVASGAALTLLIGPAAALAESVPDALFVEWHGKKPCEMLSEDAQVRIARCTLPPGAVHVCHSHPAYSFYVLSGGHGQVQDENGARKIELVTGAFVDATATPWHEFANIGETTLEFLIVEKKYQPAPPVDDAACPNPTLSGSAR